MPAINALNFPAAILQPPFFDPRRPLAVNYGATGATIGHEISHSFDDQGALFDAQGRLTNWWTEADYTHFHAAGAALARQFAKSSQGMGLFRVANPAWTPSANSSCRTTGGPLISFTNRARSSCCTVADVPSG